MRSRAHAVVAADGALRDVSSQPPLTVRRLRDPDRHRCALALVGSAAGPFDGDHLAFDLTLEAGAHASLTAAGATLALGRGEHPSRLDVTVTLAPGAHLVGETGPLIVSARSWIEVALRIRLHGDAAVTWTEIVGLGRHGEPSGAIRLHWDVERDDGPLLRQTTDLTDPGLRDWPGTIGNARVLATTLRVGPDVKARTFAASRAGAVHALAEDAELTTVLATDAVTARRQIAELDDVGS